MTITWQVLQSQDSTTSNAIVTVFLKSPDFIAESRHVTAEILQRDNEDASKLKQGIDLAIEKGVIPSSIEVEPTTNIDVIGKSVDQVCEVIMQKLGPAAQTGCILTLQGLSGTGKGTTVERLKGLLPRVSTWSNGNVFRSLTLLAVTHSEQTGCTLEEALTPALLKSFVGMLSFGKIGDKFDVTIDGLGIKARVSEVCNTLLKQKKVSTTIPTVARVTQGEVIHFVQGALDLMVKDGMSVLLEGRKQTLDYIRTPHRFELTLSDQQLIGQRRVAQVIAASALEDLKGRKEVDDAAVHLALKQSLAKIQQQRSAASTDKKPDKTPRNINSRQAVAAGTVFKKVFNVSKKEGNKYGTELSWEFKSEEDYDICFSLEKDGKTIQPKSRCTTNKGTLIIPCDESCKVVFLWDNSYSWVNSKNIDYKVTVLLPHEVEAREIEYERVLREEAIVRAEQQRLQQEAEEKERQEEAKRQEALCADIRAECARLASEVKKEKKAWEDQRDLLEDKRKQTLREIARRFEELQQELEKGINEKISTVEEMIDAVSEKVKGVTTERDAMEMIVVDLQDQLSNDLDVSELSMSDMSFGDEHEEDDHPSSP